MHAPALGDMDVIEGSPGNNRVSSETISAITDRNTTENKIVGIGFIEFVYPIIWPDTIHCEVTDISLSPHLLMGLIILYKCYIAVNIR